MRPLGRARLGRISGTFAPVLSTEIAKTSTYQRKVMAGQPSRVNGLTGRVAYDGRERADPATAAAVVHSACLEGAPNSVPGHRWSSWPVARSGPALGRTATDHNRTTQRSGAVGDPRLHRGRPEPGDLGDERLGRRRACVVVEPPGAPAGRVQLTDGTHQVVAHAATGQERAQLWDRWRSLDKNLDDYARRRSTQTAVVVLEPRSR